jgi:hypothetical protein
VYYVGFGVEGVVTDFGGLSRLTVHSSPQARHLTYHTLIDPMSSARPSFPHFGQDRLAITKVCLGWVEAELSVTEWARPLAQENCQG